MLWDLSNNAFGLDISDRALRLVQIKKKGSGLTVSSYNELTLEPGIIDGGEIIEPEKVSLKIDKLIKEAKGDKIVTKNVIAVLPEQKTFVKMINVANLGGKKDLADGDVLTEIQNHIPLAIDEIYLDWKILKQNGSSAQILAGATPKDISESYLKLIKKSGLIPLALEIEAIAIIRSIINEKEQIKSGQNIAKLIIDFGAARSGLIVYDQGTVQFTVSLPISGNKISETIAKTLKIDYKKADQAKIVCGLDQKKCEGAILKILMSSIDNLTTHIKKSITYYQSNFPQANPIAEIIICGGGANLLDIDKILSTKLKLPATIGNPLTNTAINKKLELDDKKIKSYTTAIGLALRAWQKGDIV
ncbi:MAG: type IV pilus assembly protein PilM [Patescibacteria group bacterium]|jgi:type IV pilus assembly protein PilM|nr:type IV pilus assembly protein PilM [Patescibacteria group bacterium]